MHLESCQFSLRDIYNSRKWMGKILQLGNDATFIQLYKKFISHELLYCMSY